MRRPPFKPWIGSIPCCRYRRDAPSVTASSTTAMARLSLYAALDTKTGRVHGKTAARHTSRDFVAFLGEVVSLCPPRQQIHIILDNLSAHKTQLVRDFLEAASARAASLHPDLFLLAQPSRDLVRQDRARRHRPRHLHLGPRPGSQTSPLHQRLLRQRSTHPLEILRPFTPPTY